MPVKISCSLINRGLNKSKIVHLSGVLKNYTWLLANTRINGPSSLSQAGTVETVFALLTAGMYIMDNMG